MSLLYGRITGHEKDRYRIFIEEYQVELPAVARGRLLHESAGAASMPVVGDAVECTLEPQAAFAVIARVLERRSLLTRKGAERKGVQAIAANVDFVFIATSLNMDLNRNRMDRYLTLAWDSGAQPVIVLTKADLDPASAGIRARVENWFPGVDVRLTRHDREPEELEPYLRDGKTGVVVGSSGVGKSTLINGLIGENKLKTSAIREDDDRGRHTTTSRSMWRARGGWIIDTPGLREIQMLDHDDGLDHAFSDILALSRGCKFGDCAHASEPGCAIKSALESGELERPRWENYLKLQREIAFQVRKVDPAAASEQRKKWKKIHQENRKRDRERGRR